jgi:Zn-finger nucleic acid-binding protein
MRSAATVAAMACPVCKTGLTLSDRSAIEIDYCQTCRGVWLDRGELDKIIERSGPYAEPKHYGADERRPAEQRIGYRRDDDDDRYRQKSRKKSFLSELFD